MNIVIFGRMRIRPIEPERVSLAEHRIGERRALWERLLDQLGDFDRQRCGTKSIFLYED